MSITLTGENSHLCIIDVQGRLSEIVADSEHMFKSLKKVIKTASLTHVPITYVEHCAEKIGRTSPVILPLLDDAFCLDKNTFSVADAPMFTDAFSAAKSKHVLVCGIEAHVCVYQSVRDLLKLGYSVIVVADGISARYPQDKQLALDLMQQLGATIMSAEMICFDWIESPSNPDFPAFMQIIK